MTSVISQAMRRVGILGHRPHNLRAWYATEQGAAGVDGTVIAAGLRHSDTQSLPRYLAVSQNAIAAGQEHSRSSNSPRERPGPRSAGPIGRGSVARRSTLGVLPP